MTGSQLKKYMEWSASYYNTYKDGDLTISFNENIRGYNYDMFSGVRYDVDISKEPGNRITNLTWMDGTPVKDNETFDIAVNNYRSNSQLLLNDGTISVPMSADDRTPNVKSITIEDIKAYIPEKPNDDNNSTDNPSSGDKLPQTGSMVDTNVLLLFGFLTILLGSIIAKSKKEKDI
ncbi:MAG: 5'-nucleotidase C-terminal domain-containing protein [Clostridium sp.]|uniref:LPXTG cell wall anchor domain-containing protein n=1 Tax=Clostridium sp. TaxID=1506 RepID=UPI002A8CDFBF|nr:5'-nucleotidase C-terminal domain-containing protein [Clostridium sp.]MDY5096949.1 5'-nucleotidase C-terminal domain-containing protein [Clostridium sp.]